MSAQLAQPEQSVRPAPAITPTLRSTGRRAAFWVIAGAGALIVALIAMVLSNAAAVGGPPLGAENPAPAGGMALAEVLSAQGVDVVVADSLDAALEASAAAQAADGGVTLFVSDPGDILDAAQIARLGVAEHTVVVDPSFAYLQELAPEIGFGGVGADGPIAAGAGCALAAAERAGSVAGSDDAALKTLSVPSDAAGYAACCGDAASGSSVLVQRGGPGALTLVSDEAIFANASITSAGNAALALGLLGEQPTLVWYLPTLADVAVGTPSLAELTPGWVTPVMVLLVLCGLAAAVAYGRRFGPLVIENLPVTVRASETMEGRARLYARNSERLRAVDALRIATVGRIATALGLARTASLDEVVGSAASVTGSDPSRVLATLLGDEPQNDAQLLALSDRLLDLERAVQAATRPGGATGTAPSSTHDSRTERMEP
ncbi:hypothetical protein EV379_0677 [Microterricola gilva]|uniref:DUF4350 domain-containing protein n=1 Tax=Microterricola gilva TaxID=393267 RepID=A0A4Q8AIT8_9MICO|nr:DUF4350 domain-containing protein [Microterricola gilva]RZU64382.1 hypothetical protein EV379_0677 [Microterricola gilva]